MTFYLEKRYPRLVWRLCIFTYILYCIFIVQVNLLVCMYAIMYKYVTKIIIPGLNLEASHLKKLKHLEELLNRFVKGLLISLFARPCSPTLSVKLLNSF